MRRLSSKPDSDHVNSMLLDLRQGKPLEVEVIVGEVVRMAKARGVAVPVRAYKSGINLTLMQRPFYLACRDALCTPHCCTEPGLARTGIKAQLITVTSYF